MNSSFSLSRTAAQENSRRLCCRRLTMSAGLSQLLMHGMGGEAVLPWGDRHNMAANWPLRCSPNGGRAVEGTYLRC
jgi:hypothetical protein